MRVRLFTLISLLWCQSESLIAFFLRFPPFGFDQSSCEMTTLQILENQCGDIELTVVIHTSLDSSSLENILFIGSEFFLLLLFVLFVSFLFGGGFRPRPLVPLRPTPLVSSSAAKANKSVYCFWKWVKIDGAVSVSIMHQ